MVEIILTYVVVTIPFEAQQALTSGSLGGEEGAGRRTPGARVSVRILTDGKDRPWMLKARTLISYIVKGWRPVTTRDRLSLSTCWPQ